MGLRRLKEINMIRDFKVVKKQPEYNLIGKIRVRLLVVLATFVFGLFFAQLVFANNLATDGQKLGEIQKQIENLNAQNMTLKVQIAQVSSFQTLSKKAQDLGFVDPKDPIILK